MRVAVALILILATACSFERPTAARPQPQKSALSGCYAPEPASCAKPLFVVDGKQLSDDRVDLNPGEIESVEVFRGPLALQQYGEAARNGVVVIKTKKGGK